MTAQARLLGGRYQVGELLGYGGMAEVHRGRDLRLGRDVAIKMLRTDLARDATFQERFRREAQNSAALNHPAIVAVYDTGEEISSTGEKLPFIVMEFVNGRTLKEVLAQEQRIPPRRALEMIADICAALEFSHRHGIIHRDIKPGNVMITQNGQVKVMDFGIARALASGATTMTQTSAVIGTAQYLSPEQARGESVDARSDVYAAGCVLFELLVGHPPFVGDSPVSVAYQHVREEPRAPSDINHEVPPDVDAIVLKALAKNPMNRYQSAQEMRADALRAVAGRPVLATPVMSEAETMAMQGPPSRQWQPQAATTMQRPVGGGARPPERRSTWVWASLAALGVLVVIVLGVALANSRQNANNTNAGDAPTSAPVTYTMPDLEGKTDEEALALLRSAGITQSQISRDKPEIRQDCDGTVIAQDPKPNESVGAEAKVSYQLCQKPEKVEVPDNLVGSTQDAAKSALEGLGFRVNFEEVPSLKPEGTVVKVEKAGQEVNPGQTLTVQISNGRQTKMPDVVGKPLATAQGILDNAGQFNINTVEVQDPNAVPGTVIEQNPRANATVTKGDKVTLTVVAEPNPDDTEPNPDDTESPGSGSAGGGSGSGSGEGTNGLIGYPITPARRD
ncbi:Stk1 family PASTA domain-containing Ser/Thr kinase [Paractinoplanes brasiliensis]|uniref:non-specific serine/threonine protein kinase n=1 Tax=Paractinoplanes brasiliensis TaxID=52695 RepID=A0A4R6JV53_9ACTN|nr:Stk1 family PASTA domain-containing Ser/Thr kinase [Actinoplanes brasiliensis]TDO39421.1 serine/threonine-protein kinase [Actinoplanes brasiliensis]GID32711.1 serine/threonine protein kinase [Actinoplanes brasiliensis]